MMPFAPQTIRHFWGSELFYAPAELTRDGRQPDWDEQLRD
jgi:hypothetical protein